MASLRHASRLVVAALSAWISSSGVASAEPPLGSLESGRLRLRPPALLAAAPTETVQAAGASPAEKERWQKEYNLRSLAVVRPGDANEDPLFYEGPQRISFEQTVTLLGQMFDESEETAVWVRRQLAEEEEYSKKRTTYEILKWSTWGGYGVGFALMITGIVVSGSAGVPLVLAGAAITCGGVVAMLFYVDTPEPRREWYYDNINKAFDQYNRKLMLKIQGQF
jgi:hypothetical protein